MGHPLQIIGYVPRTENEMIAKMMDMGWKDAFTAELTTIKDHGSPDSRLRMTLYIQSKDEFEDMEEELDIVDDCYPFILTNIHGPISIENDELSFMDEEEFSIHQPNGKLSWRQKERFEELFEQYN